MSQDAHLTWDDLFAAARSRLEEDGWIEPPVVTEVDSDRGVGVTTPRAAEMTKHLDGCGHCRTQLEDMLRFARGLVVAGDVTPDVATINRALSELHRVRASAAPAGSGATSSLGARVVEGLRELAAVLVADSLTPSAAVRGSVSASPRLLVYDTDAYAISVSADREVDRCVLRGQVTPKADVELASRRTVAVAAGANTRIESDLNEFGEFSLDGLPWGQFELTFTLGSDRVVIPPFRIDEHA